MLDRHDLDTTSKQMSRSFILVPMDFSYMTSYRLSIVNILTHSLATYITSQTTDGRNTVAYNVAYNATEHGRLKPVYVIVEILFHS